MDDGGAGDDVEASQARGEHGRGRGEHAGGRTLLDDAPLPHDDHVGGEGQDLGDVVGNEQGRDPRAHQALAQDGGDLGGRLDVEGSRGLVENEHLGPEDERPSDGDARGLAAGQIGGSPVCQVLDAHGPQLLKGGLPGLSSPDAARAQRERDVGNHAHVGEDARGLRDHGDTSPARGHEGGDVVDDSLPDAHGPAVHAQGPGDHLSEGGLSGAVVADDGRHDAGAQPRVRRPAALSHGPGNVDGSARHARSIVIRGVEAASGISRR